MIKVFNIVALLLVPLLVLLAGLYLRVSVRPLGALAEGPLAFQGPHPALKGILIHTAQLRLQA
jgi:hypothetical protein